MWFDEIQLRMGHSLRVGNAPDFKQGPADFEKFAVPAPVDVESFGLFSSPTFHAFTPTANAENLEPQEGDYVSPIYRALSEVIVHKQYNPIDFGENGALKKSVGLLKGQSVKGDHEYGILTTMGAVDKVMWEESYSVGNVKVPAGINARLKIDSKVNPNVARLVMMDPPGIHSTSVTVGFKWDKSHPSYTQEEFYNKLGTYDKDGKLVRRVVTLVTYYREISLVDHGADPFAKKIQDGKIVMPDLAQRDYSMNSEEKKSQKYFFFDFKPGQEDETSNSENNTIPDESNHIQTSNSEIMNREFVIALAAIFGVTVKDDNIDEAANAIKLAAQKAKDDLTAAQAQVTQLEAAKPDQAAMTALTNFKTTTLTTARAAAIASLQKLYNNAAPQPLVDVIQNMESLEGIQALKGTYDTALEDKYPLSCKDCGSTKVSRASSKTESTEEGGQEDQPAKLTNEQIREKRVKKYGTLGSMHG